MSKRIKVVIADDHAIVREGLLALLRDNPEIAVVGTAANGRDAIDTVQRTFPDVVVMDIGMPQLNGIEATRRLQRLVPQAKVIILSMHADEEYVVRALRAGVRGYIPKRAAATELLQAIHTVMRGDFHLSADISGVMVRRFLSADGPSAESDPLSDRERQILQMVAEGNSNRKIAAVLGITPKTVDTYRTRMMAKLGIHDTPGLVRYAIRRGIVQAES